MNQIQMWLLIYGHSGAATVDSAVSAVMYDTQTEAVEAARDYAADDARAHGVEVKEKVGCNGRPEFVYVETADGTFCLAAKSTNSTDGFSINHSSIISSVTLAYFISIFM